MPWCIVEIPTCHESDMLLMIHICCLQLGYAPLVCSGWWNTNMRWPYSDEVMHTAWYICTNVVCLRSGSWCVTAGAHGLDAWCGIFGRMIMHMGIRCTGYMHVSDSESYASTLSFCRIKTEPKSINTLFRLRENRWPQSRYHRSRYLRAPSSTIVLR